MSDTPQIKIKKNRPFLIDLVVRLVKEKPMGTVGGAIVLILFLAGIFANLIAPYTYDEMDLANRLSPPSVTHLLGTDQLGRDMLSRIIFGARISMIESISGAALAIILATIIGIISGFLGGKTDLIIQRFVDGWMCFPGLFVILSVMAIVKPGLLQVIIVLGTIGGIGYSRVIRSAVIGIKENIYVGAAESIGATSWQIVIKHILPNIMPTIVIIYTLGMGQMILSEATLSFLGFGVPPPAPAWGSMLNGAGLTYMYKSPWLALWPGLALSIAIFGMNMLGDAIRDILDPKLRGGLGRYSGTKIQKIHMKKVAGLNNKTTL